MEFICYPKCTTCQKARQWLDDAGISYKERNIKEQNPSASEIEEIYRKSGLPLKRFFNTSGLVYKDSNLKEKIPRMTEQEQIQLLSTNGMLVKRPILVTEKGALVGFKEKEWQEFFKLI